MQALTEHAIRREDQAARNSYDPDYTKALNTAGVQIRLRLDSQTIREYPLAGGGSVHKTELAWWLGGGNTPAAYGTALIALDVNGQELPGFFRVKR